MEINVQNEITRALNKRIDKKIEEISLAYKKEQETLDEKITEVLNNQKALIEKKTKNNFYIITI